MTQGWRSSQRMGERTLAWTLLAPALLILGAFGLFPISYALYVSLHKWRLKQGAFIGFEHFERALGKPGSVVLFLVGLLLLGGALWGWGRWRRQLPGSGAAMLAGGFAGVYFTTYAAHVIPPVKIIDNATLALLLMFAWGGFMVWVADRLKSEIVALFAIGASYYATYVPLIHSGGVSHWVILFSNLVLAVAAVEFMLRNRWLKMPVLSLLQLLYF